MAFIIRAKGHPNVGATHKTTIEITTEDFLTREGDCIIGISADKALKDLDEGIKAHLRSGGKILLQIVSGGSKDVISGQGDPRLTFKSDRSMVLRKSDFVCDRTLCIRADKAAADLDRSLIGNISNGHDVEVRISKL
ncbi:MAG: DUF371 domain-containing protein [Candidatus Altiarchaeota archaeon]|nr:DUF371 domain-containing protein [Candidatus Altiarchaeota archaeon]